MDQKYFTTLLNEMEASSKNTGTQSGESCSGHKWKVFSTSIHSLVQTLIGGIVCVTLWFAYSSSTPLSAFQLHVGLCVIGYQLLIAHGILSFQTSSWSFLSLQHRRRVHWILQTFGSLFAIAGSAVMIREKSGQFKTVHSKLALAALIFTSASLINGLTSLFEVELRRFIPPKLSKISHIILATAAFALSTACLAFGYNKKIFRKWATEQTARVLIAVVISYTLLVVIGPCFKVVKLLRNIKKNKTY